MNAIMKGNQFCFCNICDNTINVNSKSKHINSKSHKYKENYGTVVMEHEFVKPSFDEVNYLLKDTKKDWRKKYLEYVKFKFQLYGLNLKIKTALENGFRFNQTVKLTIKNDSSLSNIIICYCFKFLIPMMHSEHFWCIGNILEYCLKNQKLWKLIVMI